MKKAFASKSFSMPSVAQSFAVGILSIAVIGGLCLSNTLASQAATKPVTKPAAAQKVQPAKSSAASKQAAGATAESKIDESKLVQVSPLELLKSPSQFMNQQVEFVGVFNRFSDTGLDYKKAFRDSRDYVSLFVLRPDVEPRQIPLSELKLFFPRKKSEEVLNLEGGDTIRVRGKVFSTALDEPWVDIMDIKILKKTKESTKKPGDECC